MQEIADAAGYPAAAAVARAKGGRLAYFPAVPKEDHWLTQAVGYEKALAIGAAIAPAKSGIELLVPMGPNLAKLQQKAIIGKMLDEGRSRSWIAAALGCHTRKVQRVAALRRRRLQLSLNE